MIRTLMRDLTHPEIPRIYLSADTMVECQQSHDKQQADTVVKEDRGERKTYSASRMVVEIPINSERMSGALLVFS